MNLNEQLVKTADRVLATDPVEQFRTAVADMKRVTPETVLDLSYEMADRVTCQTVWARVKVFAERDLDAQTIRKALTDQLLRGADDTWSGRRNDLRRVEHDSLRAVTERILRIIDDHEDADES